METGMESYSNPTSPPPGVPDDIPLLDVEQLRDVVGFCLRAIWRRRGLAIGVFLLISCVVIAAVVFMPRTYFTQVRILAQQDLVMPALGNPRRAVPTQSDAPTKLATEAVMQRESLVAIMNQTHLLQEWYERRLPILKAKDWVMEQLSGPLSQDDKIEALIGVLKTHMWVKSGDGTVTIGILWPDPEMAYRIVSAAQQNFLEQRHTSEVSVIGESIAILESHATEVRATIDSAVNDLRALQPAKSAARSSRRPVVATAPKVDQEAARLQSLLTTKRQAIADLEDFRDRRIAQLQTQLAEEKATYGSAHPALASTQEAIDALSVDSPQLAALRREEGTLIAQLAKKGIAPDAVAPSKPLSPVIIPMVQANDSLNAEESYARSRLRIAVNAYEDLLDRLEGAHIELETARRAFKYKYRVLDPVQIPKKPIRPRVLLVVAGGLIFAVALAIGTAILADAASGRVIEAWQVDRLLGLPVLAEVESG
jgi:hypothetical protein